MIIEFLSNFHQLLKCISAYSFTLNVISISLLTILNFFIRVNESINIKCNSVCT